MACRPTAVPTGGSAPANLTATVTSHLPLHLNPQTPHPRISSPVKFNLIEYVPFPY